jgi:thioredoxin reductase (NADPH)
VKPELLIVGGGPAGASAALWARSLGWSVRLLERGRSAGGQLLHVHFAPGNYPAGVPGDGVALARRLAEQIEASGVEVSYDVEAVALEPRVPEVRCADGGRIEAEAVLIASGVRRRQLEVPGEREFEGRGVSYSGTQDRTRFAGEDVVVVGGGDAAFENALLLAAVGCKVTLVSRGVPRARRDFRARVAADPRIEALDATRVIAIEGDDQVRRVRLEGARGSYPLPAAGVVIKVGVLPNSEWCRGAIEADSEGYVLVDENLATSHPRVWAAGDVTRPALLGMAVATGQGALAVASIRAALRD